MSFPCAREVQPTSPSLNSLFTPLRRCPWSCVHVSSNCCLDLAIEPWRTRKRFRQSVRCFSTVEGPHAPFTQQRLEDWEKVSLENKVLHADLKKAFKAADKDRNGLVSKKELINLLQEHSSGLQPITLKWMEGASVSNIMASFNCDERGGLGFEEFTSLARAGTMLDGKFTEYWKAFQAVDTSGNGSLGSFEIKQLFDNLGHPISETKLWKIFDEYDKDGNGQIDFPEFLNLFPDELLDLREIMHYLELHPRQESTAIQNLIQAELGDVNLIFSEAELDSLLEEHAGRLTVLEASLTWCRPCKGFEKTFQKFAELFPQTLFLKFYGNSNANCKHMIEERLRVPLTPTFTFFRNKSDLGNTTGANKGRLFEKLTDLLQPDESPLTQMNAFQQQVWRSKIGLG